MKKSILFLLLAVFFASCNILGGDGSSRFGAWEKVSHDRGEYRGIDSPGKLLSKVPGTTMASQDTIQVDTSYVNSDSQLNISLAPNTLTKDRDYDLYLKLTDSTASHDMKHWNIEYVSDSTAFSASFNDGRLTAGGVLTAGIILELNCGAEQADRELLNIFYANQDSSQATLYQVQADGMMKIVQDLISGCK